MADLNFEKQVQQKMEELQFAPPEAVWQKVDAEINKERKRRPLFWLFFFLGLSGAGTVFYFSINSNNTSISKNNINVKKELPANTNQKNAERSDKIKTAESIANTESSDKSAIEKKENDINKPSLLINEKKKNEIKEEQQLENKNDVSKNYSAIIKRQKNSNKKNFINKNKNVEKKLLVNNNEKNNNEIADNNDLKNEIIAETIKANNSINSEKNKIEKTDSAKKITLVTTAQKTETKDSAINKLIAKTDKKSKPNSSWKIGATVGAGLSGINTALFKSALVATSTPSATTVNNPTTTSGSNSIPSKIINGFSFDAGFFIKKFLLQHISFSAGLHYHYYSTTIKTGSHSDSMSFIYSANLNALPVNNYYNNGSNNTYINYYHFIELPLLMSFQLNKNKNLPINWEAGFAISYLINTNALQFDNTTGIYYKNNSAFNKIQASAATALMIGFSVNGKILQIGPQFQYGFTRLLNKNTGNTEHLFFTGIKISTTFGKK